VARCRGLWAGRRSAERATSRTQRGDEQVLPVPYRCDVSRPAAGSPRMGGRDLSHDRTRRGVGARRDQADGRLPRQRFRAGFQAGERPIEIIAGVLIASRPQSKERTMRELVARYLSQGISRRGFVGGLTKAGLTATAAQSVLTAVASVSPGHAQGGSAPAAPAPAPAATAPAATAVAGVKPFQGTGGAAFAEQLIGCGVKYVFGNSASEDAQFYEALVDRPQLKYILTPHEGPGAAMAVGYIKASGEPAIVMQAAVVGMANAIGQMFNAFKEETPLVVYSFRTDQTRRAGRDGFEEVANQEQMVQPITKYSWLARRPDMIPETVRRGFKAAWTPPYGPAYISWHSDYNDERVRTEIIAQELIDPR